MLNDHRRDAADTALEERVSPLLSAAAAPSEPGPLPGEGAALAAFRASRTPTRRHSMLSSLTTAKAGIAAVVGAGLLLTGGVAAAATGTLPGAAQETARDMLVKVGVEVPGANEAAGLNPERRGGSAEVEAEDDATTTETTQSTDVAGADGDVTDGPSKGELVSELATTTEATGAEKGALISGVASEGRSKAGAEHGRAGGEHGEAGVEHGRAGEEHGERAVAPKGADSSEDDHADSSDDDAVEAAEDEDDSDEASDDDRSDDRGEARSRR